MLIFSGEQDSGEEHLWTDVISSAVAVYALAGTAGRRMRMRVLLHWRPIVRKSRLVKRAKRPAKFGRGYARFRKNWVKLKKKFAWWVRRLFRRGKGASLMSRSRFIRLS